MKCNIYNYDYRFVIENCRKEDIEIYFTFYRCSQFSCNYRAVIVTNESNRHQ